MAHAFKGKGNAHGFTDDKSGVALPPEGGPWFYANEVDLDDPQPRVGVDSKQAKADIKENGYHVTGVEIHSTVKAV
ncbi:hypothetical protein [Methylobacterium gnaphalii]|uniref:Uncharacterized protein n=1 Tax=Methylobacterium gnaphalii TaxID=1010610 RepID=A0A512JS13_9HYPH|nr:hypothetical protein [Methylobacterium gnaphalii]GEP12757.1 hypothetical protein MGN01_46020 [Methylobacterium gnaphalii]GJD70505.1 hypothetical protein MMMDOFMJ_3454 [Methylobacterium gnaphalii]GLS49144.1 hypothetical protein GCM10007885_19920 [Methylobacterium gnaphalii]